MGGLFLGFGLEKYAVISRGQVRLKLVIQLVKGLNTFAVVDLVPDDLCRPAGPGRQTVFRAGWIGFLGQESLVPHDFSYHSTAPPMYTSHRGEFVLYLYKNSTDRGKMQLALRAVDNMEKCEQIIKDPYVYSGLM